MGEIINGVYVMSPQEIQYQKDYQKQYYKTYYNDPKRKEKHNQRQQKNYELNKDKINAKAKEKFICECGCEINKGSKYYHLKSKTHLKLMESKTSNEL